GLDPSAVEPLEVGCEWRRSDLADRYVYQLSADDVAELDAALAVAEARGVALIRGLPVDRYTHDQASTIYWGVGMHLGRPWPQNAKGHLLGDVTDQGRALNDPTARGNELGGVPLPFHSDGSDLVGLFCLDAGLEGGDSLVANAVTIHNDLVRSDPEIASRPYDAFPYDLRGEQAPGAKSWYTMPVFSRRAYRLFVRYVRADT